MTNAKTIVIATHRRSGTHWTIDALRNNSPEVCQEFLTLERISTGHDSPVSLSVFRQQLNALDGRVLIKVHDLPSADNFQGEAERNFAQQLMSKSPVIYVHRDGRDVMVSLYYYLRSFSDAARDQSFAEFLRAKSALDGVATGMSRPAYWAHHAHTWMRDSGVQPISYSALESNYAQTVRDMAEFLRVGLRRSLQAIDLPEDHASPSLLERARWKLGLRQKRLSSAVQPRRGASGDWRNHFDEKDLAFFMSEAGEMLRQLGYVN